MMSQLTLVVSVVVVVAAAGPRAGGGGGPRGAGPDGAELAWADGLAEAPSATWLEAVGPPPETMTTIARMTPSAMGMASGIARRENRSRPPWPRPALPGPVSI